MQSMGVGTLGVVSAVMTVGHLLVVVHDDDDSIEFMDFVEGRQAYAF